MREPRRPPLMLSDLIRRSFAIALLFVTLVASAHSEDIAQPAPAIVKPTRPGIGPLDGRVRVDPNAAPKRIYDPSHPDADEQGFVAMPDINVVTEMVDMMVASRAYEANITAVDAAKQMAERALNI